MMDLHTHSCFSDGLNTPEELVETAYNAGVRLLALTDHDTIGGIPRFFKACEEHPDLTHVIGAELSCNGETLEILALGIQNPVVFSDYRKTIEKRDISFQEMIKFALRMEAIPVLAHPVRTGLTWSKGYNIRKLVAELKGYGLQGIECFHPQHTKPEAKEFIVVAKEFGLLITAGSDYHGKSVYTTPASFKEVYQAALPELKKTAEILTYKQVHQKQAIRAFEMLA